jgi:serine protease AprX
LYSQYNEMIQKSWGLSNQGQTQVFDLNPMQTYRLQGRTGEDIHLMPPQLGRKVRVAVIDTGIDTTHPLIQNQIYKNSKECSAQDKSIDNDGNQYPGDCTGWSILGEPTANNIIGTPEFKDEIGHGTHVAGISAGDGRLSGGTYAGIAPKASLLIAKVLDQDGNGSVESVLEGMRWVLSMRKKYPIRVVNISVGAKPNLEQRQKKRLILGAESLWDAGIAVVASAGNDGPERGSIASPGDSRKIITVGAYEEIRRGRTRMGQRWKYSGRGPSDTCIVKPDLVAPGLGIISCGRIDKEKKAYVEKSGTSMATPIVSGAAALAMEKYPGITNEEFVRLLSLTATDLGEPWNKQGFGMLNVRRLLENK